MINARYAFGFPKRLVSQRENRSISSRLFY